eukprot:gnl/TRDRNA2_/TRDRNA2_157215_c1_seq1.p3 gnl/TRDRNA2_/TRDRNA2_157215_c1~~gnl/TRDRNA2_/TRDRNA2_157215_c1_seq1.p3  ORF type:complete len:144 (-),score=43.90 gnl/TRDRNA2_/TRDRNA2_157215_c1_seq1:188-619(-)
MEDDGEGPSYRRPVNEDEGNASKGGGIFFAGGGIGGLAGMGMGMAAGLGMDNGISGFNVNNPGAAAKGKGGFKGGGGMGGGMGGAPPMGMPADNRPAEERYAAQIDQLVGMGFADRPSNIQALQMANGDINQAITFLLGGGDA